MDGNVELQGFGVNISDIDTTLVGEENGVVFTGRVDADVVFGGGWMGEERLEDEGHKGTRDRLDLDKGQAMRIWTRVE